jgi:hypothetical protein
MPHGSETNRKKVKGKGQHHARFGNLLTEGIHIGTVLVRCFRGEGNESYMFSSHVTNLESCKKLAVSQVTTNNDTVPLDASGKKVAIDHHR